MNTATSSPDLRIPAGQPAQRAALGVLALIAVAYVWTAAQHPGGDAAVCDSITCKPLRLDPNTATRDELMLLPGIGPVIADNIVAYREGLAPRRAFDRVEDLDVVKRIGPATIAKLREYLYIAPAGTAAPAAPVPSAAAAP